VVVEGDLGHIAGAKAHGIERFSIAPIVIRPVFRIEYGAGRKKNPLQFADVLGQKTAQTRPHGLEKNKLFLFKDGDVLKVS